MKNIFNFSDELVDQISLFLQDYLAQNHITQLTADECATILALNDILPNNVGPKPGFNFRQLLRDGRDGKIKMVKGVFQEKPHTKWLIRKS